MTQKERIEFLSMEQRELGDLLNGMSACGSIPTVFIAMARAKALRIAEELMKLEAEAGAAPASPMPKAAPVEASMPQAPAAETEREAVGEPAAEEVIVVEEAPKVEEEPQVEAPKAEAPAEAPKPEMPKPEAQKAEPQQEQGPKREPMSVREAFAPVFREFAQTTPAAAPRGDIRSLLTMGDKFLFQRELFRGDIGMLNFTLDRLNKIDSMDEALAFIRTEYRWADDAPGVKEFMELLERYYLNTLI
jgi:outer membrane biosynthesis protein TonB